MSNSFWKGFATGILIFVLIFAGFSFYLTDGQISLLADFAQTLFLVKTQALTEIDNARLFEGAIAGLVSSMGDKYSEYLPAKEFTLLTDSLEGSYSGVGLVMELDPESGDIVVVSTIKGGPAFGAGILSGDHILAIDGEDTAGMTLEEASEKIKGEAGTKVVLTIKREGWAKPKDFVIERSHVEIPSVEYSLLYSNDEKMATGYIRINTFTRQTGEEVKSALEELLQKGAQNFVLDLRQNPGGELYAAIDVASSFLPQDMVIVYTVGRDGKEALKSTGNKITDLPLVVLVDEGTASAAEIVSAALKENGRAVLIGEKTFGKGLVQTIFPTIGGSGVKVTTHKYLTPQGNDINEKGIEPDVVVTLDDETTYKVLYAEPDPEKDPQLKRALLLLEKGTT